MSTTARATVLLLSAMTMTGVVAAPPAAASGRVDPADVAVVARLVKPTKAQCRQFRQMPAAMARQGMRYGVNQVWATKPRLRKELTRLGISKAEYLAGTIEGINRTCGTRRLLNYGCSPGGRRVWGAIASLAGLGSPVIWSRSHRGPGAVIGSCSAVPGWAAVVGVR